MVPDLWRQYARLYRGSYGLLAAAVVVSLARVLALVPLPFLVGRAFEYASPGARVTPLVLLGAAILLLQVASGAATMWTRYVILRITKHVVRRLRDEAVATLFRLPRAFYDRADLSRLHDVVVHESERVDIMSNAILGEFLPGVVLVAGISAALIVLNWTLFAITFVFTAGSVVLVRKLGRRVKRRVDAFHASFRRFSHGVLFLLRARDLVRIRSSEAWEAARQHDRFEDLRETSGAMAWTATAYAVVQHAIQVASASVVLVVGGLAVSRGSMRLGSLLAFFAGLALLREPFRAAINSLPAIIEGRQSLAELLGLINAPEAGPYDGQAPIAFTGRIALEDVSFRYNDTPVLRGVSMAVEPGRVVALSGPNGSGKSTIVSLMLGFYRPQQGRVLADGEPYERVDVASVRQRMGVLLQEPFVFSGTIRDNIGYGHPDASAEAIVAASTAAAAHRFIADLPQGYETAVGENGHLLSSGQRQRLALARALVGDPALLILDEPTNHIDDEGVRELVANLGARAHGPAVLLVSHREEVVRLADVVYHLDGGVIVRVEARHASIAVAPAPDGQPCRS